jgi:hypothetical protein
MAAAVEQVWRGGARMDSWTEHRNAASWWAAIAAQGIDVDRILHQPFDRGERLPWDHILVKSGRNWLEKEHARSVAQLACMEEAHE